MSPLASSFSNISARGSGARNVGKTYFLESSFQTDTLTSDVSDLVQDSSGNILTVGTFYNASSGLDAYVAKYDIYGNLCRQQSLTNTGLVAASRYTLFSGAVLDSSGNLYASGYYKNSSNGYNSVVVKYNSSGALQWQRSIADSNSASSQNGNFFGIALDGSNNVYVVGNFKNTSGGSTAYILKYDSSGSLQWQRELADTLSAQFRFDRFTDVAIDASGVYVCGYWRNSSGGLNALTAKYNTSGTLQWQRSLADGNAAASQFSFAQKIVLDSSSNVYTAGVFKNTSGGNNAYVAKYDSSGTLQWQRSLADGNAAGSQNTSMSAFGKIGIDASGNIYVPGSFKNNSGGQDAFVVKYNASGSLQWQRSINDLTSASTRNSLAVTTMVSPIDGKLYIGGYYKFVSNGNGFYPASYMKVPVDGTKTGTYTIYNKNGDINGITYAVSSLTEAAGSLTASTPSNSDNAGSVTDSAGPLAATVLPFTSTFANVI